MPHSISRSTSWSDAVWLRAMALSCVVSVRDYGSSTRPPVQALAGRQRTDGLRSKAPRRRTGRRRGSEEVRLQRYVVLLAPLVLLPLLDAGLTELELDRIGVAPARDVGVLAVLPEGEDHPPERACQHHRARGVEGGERRCQR